MTRRIRVLHVLGALSGGGIQTFLLEFLRHHDHDKFEMHVCEMANAHGPLADDARRAGATLHLCSLSESPFTFRSRFAQLLRAGQYDVVHTHRSSNIQAIPLRIAALEGVPTRVAHYHNVRRAGTLSPRDVLDPILRRVVLRHATHVVGVSNAVLATQFGGDWSRDGRFTVIKNGVDTERFARSDARASIRREMGFSEEDVVIGHAGRFSHAKNHRALIEIAALTCREFPHARFLLAGEGPLRSEIEAQIARHSIADRVVLAGWREDMASLYQAMDMFLFPSHWEGLPLALIEAQAASLPCVASSIASNLEVLAPELHELTFAPDDFSAGARNVTQLISDPQKHHALARAALAQSAQFDIRIVARKIEQLYRPGLE